MYDKGSDFYSLGFDLIWLLIIMSKTIRNSLKNMDDARSTIDVIKNLCKNQVTSGI